MNKLGVVAIACVALTFFGNMLSPSARAADVGATIHTQLMR